jgi:DNA-binding IclR family transcriptional regulator
MNSVSGVGVLDKCVAILQALVDDRRDLAELQDASGLPRATTHRLAVALEAHRLVRRDADGRFVLGLGLIALGRAAAEGFGLAEAARPILTDLRDDTGESVQLFVRDEGVRRCVVSLASPHALRWIVPEGAVLPLDRGSAGKVLGDGQRLAQSVEEREPGVASVSAAVLDRAGSVVGAVSVSGPVERLTRSPQRRFGEAVQRAAASIGSVLGG